MEPYSQLLRAGTCATNALISPHSAHLLQTWCTEGPCGHDFCNETEIHSVADFIVSSGMNKLGYQYVNLDDCWAGCDVPLCCWLHRI